jgi:hypothetical protein
MSTKDIENIEMRQNKRVSQAQIEHTRFFFFGSLENIISLFDRRWAVKPGFHE